MTPKEKIELFHDEINAIKNPNMKIAVMVALAEVVPDYFFTIPASSTGKYHPSYCLGDGGLVRHSKALVRIGLNMIQFKTLFDFTDNERDIFIVAGILHDGAKSGIEQSNFTVHEHPLIITELLSKNTKVMDALENTCMGTSDILFQCINCHMSQWNTNKYSNVVLPLPKTKLDAIVALSDYLASRKNIEIDFNTPIS
jgi:hypothetical protein